jgi:hypothetical protein
MLPAWAGAVQVIALFEKSEPPKVRGFQVLPGDKVEEVGLSTDSGDVRIFSTSL